MNAIVPAVAVLALLLLSACVVETPTVAPARPAPVVLAPAPSTGTVVVQPQ